VSAPAPSGGARGGGATELYAVLGRPIAHSLSPRLHEAGFRALGRNAVYVACDVGEAELGQALKGLAALGARGANLTAPLKTAALAHLAALTDEARAAGAVNTVAFDPGGTRGHNTDGAGFVAFLSRHQVPVRGAHVACIGGGGAALGLAEPLLAAGALDVALVVRDPKVSAARSAAPAARRARWFALGARDGEEAVRAASIVVQATPLGAAPGDPLPCPVEWIDARAVAVDLRYHPATTPWLTALKARRVRSANGLGLLIEQALLAQDFWNHATPPRIALEEAVSWSEPFAPA
jgi:shikimate dehydrogenase